MSKLEKFGTQFERSFTEVLEAAFASHGDKPCLGFQDEKYSYREVDQLSSQIANQLIADGFEKGMHGAVYSSNSAIAFIAALGIIRAGGVWIPVNARNSQADNIQILVTLGCDVLLFQDQFAEPAAEVKAKGQCKVASVSLDSQLMNWVSEAATVAPVVELAGTDLLTIPQTGGTTGLPKGVMISHRNFCGIGHLMTEVIFQPEEVMMCVAPMTHVGGRLVLTTMALGLRYVILDKADPQTILSTIQNEKVTNLFLPPTVIYSLLEQPNLDTFDLSSLRVLGYGSAPMAPEKIREAIERIGPVMQGGFGQTECPMSISFLSADEHFIDGEIAENRLRSVGRPSIISDVAILDNDANPLPQGEKGEIGVKGAAVSEGYYQAPEETAKIRANGWHLTGDIGYIDEEGFLYIVDRKKDMIITGGFNVYSAEVEATLMKISGIKLAAVVGTPDPKWGELVTAYVEVDEGAPDAQAIIDQCKELIGGVKAPKVVHFVDQIPRTAVGKINKKALRTAAE